MTDPPIQGQQIDVLLQRLQEGDRTAMDELLPLLLAELRDIAHVERWHLWAGGTLCTTALVHEAYLKLRGNRRLSPQSRRHLLRTAALAMRQILIDHARARRAEGERQRTAHAGMAQSADELHRQSCLVLDVDAALRQLEHVDARLAQVVVYRYFAGYGEAEIADLMEVSERTVRRDWFKAKAWLSQELTVSEGALP